MLPHHMGQLSFMCSSGRSSCLNCLSEEMCQIFELFHLLRTHTCALSLVPFFRSPSLRDFSWMNCSCCCAQSYYSKELHETEAVSLGVCSESCRNVGSCMYLAYCWPVNSFQEYLSLKSGSFRCDCMVPKRPILYELTWLSVTSHLVANHHFRMLSNLGLADLNLVDERHSV